MLVIIPNYINLIAHKFRLNHETGSAVTVPLCSSCNKPVRPNVNLRDDLDWLEDRAASQNENFMRWFEPRITRSMTILEIGAGPV